MTIEANYTSCLSYFLSKFVVVNEDCTLCQLSLIRSTQGDAPAPFMTFEAGNFPPELMREVIPLSDIKDFAPICEMGALENVHWIDGLLTHAEV